MTDSLNNLDEGSPSERSQRLRTTVQAVHRRTPRAAWLARTARIGLCLTSLLFAICFAVALGSGGLPALLTPTPLMRLALTLPYAVALLALATALSTVIAWRRSFWSLWGRLHQTVVAVLGLAFVWQLFTLGFLL